MKARKNKISIYMVIGIVYTVILLTISTAYSFLSEDLTLNTKITTPQIEKNCYIDKTLVDYDEESGIYYYEYFVVLDYNGEDSTTGWRIDVQATEDSEVVKCDNANCRVESDALIINNTDSNGVLYPGNSATSFTVGINTTDPDFTFDIINTEFYEDKNYAIATWTRTSLTITTNEKYRLTIQNINSNYKIISWKAVVRTGVTSSVRDVTGADYTFSSRTLTLTSLPDAAPIEPGESFDVTLELGLSVITNSTLSSLTVVTEDGREHNIVV